MTEISSRPIDQLTRRELLQLGNQVKEKLSPSELVTWSIELLVASATATRQISEVEELIESGKNHNQWFQAQSIFSSIRSLTLMEEKKIRQDPIYLAVLYLAENTAKVVYNASGGDAPFDDDAIDWIPVCVHELYKSTKSRKLKLELERKLFSGSGGHSI